jgi:hypothetical protein
MVHYRGFIVYPFKDKGIVIRRNGSVDFTDSNGYRMIKDIHGKRHPVSQIIYAVGSAYPSGYPKSYKFMKTVIVSYRDKDKSNCNYDNLTCKVKKKIIKQAKFENEIGMCFK